MWYGPEVARVSSRPGTCVNGHLSWAVPTKPEANPMEPVSFLTTTRSLLSSATAVLPGAFHCASAGVDRKRMAPAAANNETFVQESNRRTTAHLRCRSCAMHRPHGRVLRRRGFQDRH